VKVFKNTLARKFTFVFSFITILFIVSALLTYGLTQRRQNDSSITEVLTEQRSLANKYVRDFFYYLKTNDISKVSNTIKKFENNILLISSRNNKQLNELSRKTLERWKELKRLAGTIIQEDKRNESSYNQMLLISNNIDFEYSKFVFIKQREYTKGWKFIFLFQAVSVLAIILISIFVLFKINNNIIAGINEVKDAAIQLSKGNFFNLSNNFSNDEIGELAEAIKSTNSLIDKLHYQQDSLKVEIKEKEKLQKQMISHEKLASLGAVSSGIAHELRNPLNFILNFSNALTINLDETDDLNETKREILQISNIINKHAKRATQIIDQILGHTSSKKKVLRRTNLSDLINTTLKLKHKTFILERNIKFKVETNYDDIEELLIYPQDFSTALSNIFDNAMFSMEKKFKKNIEGYKPEIQVLVTDLKREDQIQIEIIDNGMGIDSSILSDIYNPFFTTKSTGEGSGLGLTMSYDIVTFHKGEIEISSDKDEWTKVTIRLPKKVSIAMAS
jgi:signal transduction histidine kinase